MEAAMNMHNMTKAAEQTDTAAKEGTMTILEATPGQTYTIKEINTEDEEMNGFLFRLGCYSGEPITLVSKKRKSCVVVIKDGRYNIDNMLAEAIEV
jgi:ferrous iron transport protein A